MPRDTRQLLLTLLPLACLAVAAIGADYPPPNALRPESEAELRSWLEKMVWYHHFTNAEIAAATGREDTEIAAALNRLDIRPETKPERPDDAPLLVLPYPGGRHPRIGFLDGAIDPHARRS